MAKALPQTVFFAHIYLRHYETLISCLKPYFQILKRNVQSSEEIFTKYESIFNHELVNIYISVYLNQYFLILAGPPSPHGVGECKCFSSLFVRPGPFPLMKSKYRKSRHSLCNEYINNNTKIHIYTNTNSQLLSIPNLFQENNSCF